MEPSLPRVFSSLQYTEDEIKPAKVDFSNPEIQDYLKECTITPAQLEWFQSRDYALAKLLWGKFTAKIEAAGILKDWGNEALIPGAAVEGSSEEKLLSLGIAFLDRRAPHLTDEFKAQKEWQKQHKERQDREYAEAKAVEEATKNKTG